LLLATPAERAWRCLVGFEDFAAGLTAAPGVVPGRLAGSAAGLTAAPGVFPGRWADFAAGLTAAPGVVPGPLAFGGLESSGLEPRLPVWRFRPTGGTSAREASPGPLAPRRRFGWSSNRGSIKLCRSNAGGDPKRLGGFLTSVSRGVVRGSAIVAVSALVVAVSALVPGQAGAPAGQTGSASPPLATPIESSPLPSGSLPPSAAPSITAPEPTPAAVGTARVVRETAVSTVSGGCDDAFEPIVATHPSDPSRIAVAYQRYRRIGGRCHLDPVVAISHDGGTTWKVATARPWAGSGRFPDHHVAIAWGPGPRNGAARLYWADMTVAGPSGGHLASVAWSDDEGASWSRLHVERRTPPWIGGFPDITVDRNPASPNYGVVYVAYNWLVDPRRGPGLRLLASADFGRTWRAVEIPPAPGPVGFGDTWRIAYRIRGGSDGAVYVSFYQADLRVWSSAHIFSKGGMANVGRLGFAVARVSFDRRSGRFTVGSSVLAASLPRNSYTVNGTLAPGTSGHVYVDPMWSQGLDVDPSSGRVFLAIGEYRPSSGTTPRGRVRVGHSDDGGRTWQWVTLAALPSIGQLPQSSFKPTVAVAGGAVFVGFHGTTDAPVGTAVARHIPTIGTFYAVSFDGGLTFGAPVPISSARWNVAALAAAPTGPGLRERADQTADGAVFFVYGDGRLAAPPPSRITGRSAVFGALVRIERPS
jgi:hypothetical protein